MTFSFVFPTRARTSRLVKSVDSILKNASRPRNVSIVVAYDIDDEETIKIKLPDNCVKIAFRQKNEFAAYYNDCIPYAKGDAIWAWGDDCLMLTRKWDRMIESLARRKGWDVWMGSPMDVSFLPEDVEKFLARANSPGPKLYPQPVTNVHPITKERFPSFPILSRDAVAGMGFIHNPRLRVWGADLYNYMIFKNLERIIDMRRVEILTEATIGEKKESRMKIFHEDLQRMIDAGVARREGDHVAYDIATDLQKLRLATGLPRMWRLP
jgi:hypothetical protein